MSTGIQWTDETWNPVTGCSKVSPGCAHCYAETNAIRLWPTQYHMQARSRGLDRNRQFTDVWCHDDRLTQPLHWKKPRRIFVNSMSDLFHEAVPDAFIERVFSVMALAHRHTFQVLTKRPERMNAWFRARRFDVKGYAILQTEKVGECLYAHPWPAPNVWLGVSVENQRMADERIPLLLQTPAAVRFISAEPLLGPIDFVLRGDHILDWDEDWHYNVLSGEEWAGPRDENTERSQHLDWVIVGGESGPSSRPFDLAWARSIVQQCQATGVPVFVKQLGADPRSDEPTTWPNGRITPYPFLHPHLRDRKGGDPSEWPADLRVRTFPDERRVRS